MQLLLLLVLTSLLSTNFTLCRQGIKGKVVWLSGNQMPGPGVAKPTGAGIKREIFIYKPATQEQVVKSESGNFYKEIKTALVSKITSKEDGSFNVKLPPGEYSVFIKEPQGYFANLFDEKGRINVVRVEAGMYTSVILSVDYAAAY